MVTTTQPPYDPHYDQEFWKERDEQRNAARAEEYRKKLAYLENKKEEDEKAAQDERDREARALKKAIENSVPLPVEYKILEPTNNGEKADRTAAEAKLKEMLKDLTPVKLTDVKTAKPARFFGLKKPDLGIYVLDMRKLYIFDPTNLYGSSYLIHFKSEYERNIKPSQIVFIKVIGISFDFFGRSRNEKKKTLQFYAYYPNCDPIMCMREIGHEGKQGQYRSEPTQCVFQLPLVDDIESYVTFYNPQAISTIPPNDVGSRPTPPTDTDTTPLLERSSMVSPDDKGLLEDTISPNDVGYRTTPPTDTDTRSELDKQGGIKPLLDEHLKGKGYVGGGKKLRSAKKTSKRRSVKSKPRHYRRSVGSINHRRKKTTRRRRQ
jgi:hypothetical protein